MKEIKPSLLLAALAWANLFVLCWLLILRIVPADWLSGFWIVFIFIVATMSSAVYKGPSK